MTRVEKADRLVRTLLLAVAVSLLPGVAFGMPGVSGEVATSPDTILGRAGPATIGWVAGAAAACLFGLALAVPRSAVARWTAVAGCAGVVMFWIAMAREVATSGENQAGYLVFMIAMTALAVSWITVLCLVQVVRRPRSRVEAFESAKVGSAPPESSDRDAPPVLRVIARGVDTGLLIALLYCAPIAVTELVVDFVSETVTAWTTAWSLAAIFLYELLSTRFFGQTAGKALTSIEVRAAAGGAGLGWGRSLLRGAILFGGTLLFLSSLLFLIPSLLRPDRVALHDLAVGARVRRVDG